MKETRKHTDQEVARVMDTLTIAIRNKPTNSNATSADPIVDAKKEDADQSTNDSSSDGWGRMAIGKAVQIAFVGGDGI